MNKNLFDYFPKITQTTYDEMAKETGLDMQAMKRDLHYNDNQGVAVENPEMVAVTRVDDGRYLSTVSKKYGLVQYDDILRFTEILVSDEGAEYISGGIVGSGERAFIAMKTGDHVNLGGRDDIECYFYVTTGHGHGAALDVIPAPLRKLNNTVLRMPDLKGFKFRHTKNINVHMARAKMSIAKVKTYWKDFQKSFGVLAAIRLTDGQLDDYLKMVVEGTNDSTRAENIREEIKTIFLKDPTINSIPSTHGTLLGAYFSVVQFADFETSIRKSNKRDALAARLVSLIDGTSARRKANGYGMALHMSAKLNGVKVGI